MKRVLAIILALASSYKDIPVPADTVAFGEVGLSGEIRSVNQAQQRVNEAVRLGFNKIILPYHNSKSIDNMGAEVIGVKNLRQAFEAISE